MRLHALPLSLGIAVVILVPALVYVTGSNVSASAASAKKVLDPQCMLEYIVKNQEGSKVRAFQEHVGRMTRLVEARRDMLIRAWSDYPNDNKTRNAWISQATKGYSKAMNSSNKVYNKELSDIDKEVRRLALHCSCVQPPCGQGFLY